MKHINSLIAAAGLFALVSCVGSQSRQIINHPSVAAGHIERVELASKYVPTRPVDIWLPEGYPAAESYNVLYMHDGGALYGLEAPSFLTDGEWRMDEKITALMAEGKIAPTIVVGIHNSGSERAVEYFPQAAIANIEPSILKGGHLDSLAQKGRADNYLRFMVEELKPYIDSQFKSNRAKEGTFIMGSSMGGLISLYAICEHPEVFGAAGCISTHWVGQMEQNEEIPGAIYDYIACNLPPADQNKIYFSTGTIGLDSLYPIHQRRVDMLMSNRGFYRNHSSLTEYFEGEDHKVSSWVKNLESPLLFMMEL